MALALDTAAQDLLFREARTANTFTDEPVTDEQIQDIYDLVKYGPTMPRPHWRGPAPWRLSRPRRGRGSAHPAPRSRG